MFRRKDWTYGNNIRDREYLNCGESFDELVEQLCAAVRAVRNSQTRFVVEPKGGKYGQDDPLLKRLECRRPAWWIQLDGPLLDRFFNGLMGIRAQYYASPYHGRRKNQLLISKLADQLIRLASSIEPSVEKDFLRLSLDQPSAKVWISEKDVGGNKIIRASDLKLDEESIQNDWLDLAREVQNGAYGTENYQLYCAAINGVRAPIPDQLEVKGAWLTGADQREYVTPDKRDRGIEIASYSCSASHRWTRV